VIPTVNGAVKVLGYQVQDADENLHPDMTNNLSLYSLEQANEMIMKDMPDDKHTYWFLNAYYKGDIENPVIMFTGKNPRL
jgi:hypothetical protein